MNKVKEYFDRLHAYIKTYPDVDDSHAAAIADLHQLVAAAQKTGQQLACDELLKVLPKRYSPIANARQEGFNSGVNHSEAAITQYREGLGL